MVLDNASISEAIDSSELFVLFVSLKLATNKSTSGILGLLPYSECPHKSTIALYSLISAYQYPQSPPRYSARGTVRTFHTTRYLG